MTYEPTNIIVGEWGTLSIIIGGNDLTYYRGVPTQVANWSTAEPFSDRTAQLVFPSITSFDPLSAHPFKEEDDVEIWRTGASGVRTQLLWEGYVASISADLAGDSDQLTVECVGALYQIDNFVKPPSFGFQPIDAGVAISTELNLRARNYGLRLQQMSSTVWSNTPSRKVGSFNKMLTGWTQEMLQEAATPSFMTQNESTCAIVVGPNGYWLGGDHGSVISFGDRFPNYGSSTWRNITKIYTAKDKGWYVADFAMHPNATYGWWLSLGGTVWPMGGDHTGNFETSQFHYGDAEGASPDKPFVSIKATPSGGGYWLMNSAGSVWTFGDASFHGANPPLFNISAANGHEYPDLCIDMVPTPSGNGYWIMTWCGRVYEYGDAQNWFDAIPFYDKVFSALETTADGNGLWALDTYGRIHASGTAQNLFGGSIQHDVGADNDYHWIDLCRSEGGNGLYAVRNDGLVVAMGDAVHRGSAIFDTSNPNNGGKSIGYTLTKEISRKPVLRTKNTWKKHWTISTATPGITHSLTRDRTTSYNTYYGEGTDVTGQGWRNTKYANAFPYSGDWKPPTYPFFTINTVTYNTDAVTNGAVSVWQRAMKNNGWDLAIDGIFDVYDSNICRLMQMAAGLEPNGTVDLQTWATTFLNSPINLTGPSSSAYIAPLVVDTKVEPFLYKANGEIMDTNPNFTSSVMRRETYSSYGEKASKPEAIMSAFAQMKQFADPGWYGTITLGVDPEEDSKYGIRAGQNIVLKGFKGEDLFFHITECTVNWESQTVSLTVDTKARDYVTVNAMIERDRTIGETGLKVERKFTKKSDFTEEITVFDSEASAGFIPAHGTPGGEWNVVRVPAGEIGNIVKTEFATYPATLFAIAVFDRPITPKFLNDYTRLFQGGFFDGGIMSDEFWELFQQNAPDKGLMTAWGGQGDLCGTWPKKYDEGEIQKSGLAGISGKFKDDGQWTYWSSQPPWLWVGIWAITSTFIEGRFYGGTTGGFNFSDIDTLANPQQVSNQGVGAIGRDLTFAEQMEMIKGWTS